MRDYRVSPEANCEKEHGISSGARIQDNHAVLTHAQKLATQIESGRERLLANAFPFRYRRGPIILRIHWRFV